MAIPNKKGERQIARERASGNILSGTGTDVSPNYVLEEFKGAVAANNHLGSDALMLPKGSVLFGIEVMANVAGVFTFHVVPRTAYNPDTGASIGPSHPLSVNTAIGVATVGTVGAGVEGVHADVIRGNSVLDLLLNRGPAGSQSSDTLNEYVNRDLLIQIANTPALTAAQFIRVLLKYGNI